MKNLILVLFVFISQFLFSQVTYRENDPFAKFTKQSVDIITNADYNTLSKKLMDDINTYRVKNGLSKLTYNQSMFNYAKSHVDTLTDTKTYFHSNLNEGQYVLENINLLTTVGTFLSYDEKWLQTIPSLFMDTWKRSPGHNANLLHSNITEVGVAITSVVYMKNGFYVHETKAVMVAR